MCDHEYFRTFPVTDDTAVLSDKLFEKMVKGERI